MASRPTASAPTTERVTVLRPSTVLSLLSASHGAIVPPCRLGLLRRERVTSVNQNRPGNLSLQPTQIRSAVGVVYQHQNACIAALHCLPHVALVHIRIVDSYNSSALVVKSATCNSIPPLTTRVTGVVPASFPGSSLNDSLSPVNHFHCNSDSLLVLLPRHWF